MKTTLAIAAFLTVSAGQASALTYNIDLSGFDAIGSTITGTMTYDNFDAIGQPDAFDLVVTSTAFTDLGEPASTVLTSSNPSHEAIYVGLDGLNARAALTFDMNAGPLLSIVNYEGLSGSAMGFCIGGVGSNNLSGFPGFFPCEGGIGIIAQGSVESQGTSSGVIELGTVGPSPVPLPAGLPMLGAALGLLGLMRRKRA